MSGEYSAETKAVLEKVEKMLRLAASNPNEAEAANAASMAQKLLTAHNLDMAAVEENSGGTGKRAQEDLYGGRYEWQRDLWDAVSDLNFCYYWNEYVFIQSDLGTAKEYRKVDGNYRYVRGMWQHRHRLIGRLVNIAATKSMATYLEGVCDRLARERCRTTSERPNGRWANSYREGLTNRVIIKIYDRRKQLLSEEQKERADKIKTAAATTIDGISTASALTISSYSKSEEEANIDFKYGEGTSARWAKDRAEQAAAERAADEAYTRWAAANPEKAAKAEAERKAKFQRKQERENRSFFRGKDTGAFLAGYEAGENVSLDLQAEHSKVKGYLK